MWPFFFYTPVRLNMQQQSSYPSVLVMTSMAVLIVWPLNDWHFIPAAEATQTVQYSFRLLPSPLVWKRVLSSGVVSVFVEWATCQPQPPCTCLAAFFCGFESVGHVASMKVVQRDIPRFASEVFLHLLRKFFISSSNWWVALSKHWERKLALFMMYMFRINAHFTHRGYK